MKTCGKILLVMQFVAMASALGQSKLPLLNDGSVPLWLTNGPFEVETTGFGDLSDKQVIDEVNLNAGYNTPEKNPSLKDGSSRWNYLSTDENGFADVKEYYSWKSLTGAEKIWYEKIVYAYADIYSDKEQSAVLKFGGNTVISIRLNGETVYQSLQTVNARKDEFSKAVTLKKGENRLLVKVANSHRNHAVSFFIPVNYEWGFYLRLTADGNESPKDVSVVVNNPENKIAFNIIPTYFYKKINGVLSQKYLLEINSGLNGKTDAELSFRINNNDKTLHFPGLKFGLNEKEFYVPETKTPQQVHAKLKLGAVSAEENFAFRALPKYELYYMPTSHMDIGYTNPQPVVIERQLKTLNEVVEKCQKDKNFRWTIETMWLLENYRKSVSKEKFTRLIDLIKKGQVAVSPIYTNPFTGWISENEMTESFRMAQDYKEKYGISYSGAIYNDVPGQSWALPQALKKSGINLLVDGINEIFSNYKYQRSLPKVFSWQGSNSDKVTLYLTEAYTEGVRYGLEQDTSVIENRIWHTINNLTEREYPFNKILVTGSFSDNSGIAGNQYNNALKWNSTYEYPKFIVSTLNEFSKALSKENLASLETIKGDWTSDWDILNQGETKRMLKYRRVQNELPSAEVMASVSQMENPGASFSQDINSIYSDMLSFSGHGSGLEYGFGTREENIITDRFREGYVESSFLKTQELLERSTYRLTTKKESFDSQGIIVFNTLSWNRSMPVEVQFLETDMNNYSVIDLSDNSKVNSFKKGDRLYFMANDVPGIGYKQYELVNSSEKYPTVSRDNGTIENEYYKISVFQNELSIIDKTSGRNILLSDSAIKTFIPVRKVSQTDNDFKSLEGTLRPDNTEKNNVYEELTASYADGVFKAIKFRLWKNLNRIDLNVSLNLEGLKETGKAEEYGLPFVLNIPDSKVRFESLGGLASPEDRFSSVGHTYFAVRRAININGNNDNYVIASPDCRIFTLDTTGGRSILIANVLNNFPKSWNRNEDKTGTAEFNFSISKVNDNNDVTRFGYEASTEPVVRRSWYRKNEPVKQYVKLSNPAVKLISFRPVGENTEAYELIFQNSSPEKDESLTVSSEELFTSAKVTEVNFMGEKIKNIPVSDKSIKLDFSPNSINKLTVQKLHN